MNKLNDRLCGLEVERFVTMVTLVLDPQTHQLTIVNAGHMPPLCRRADGTVEELGAAVSGIPLGIVSGYEYKETAISLGPGESLTMYTDGVSDAMDADGKYYQSHRIRGHVQSRWSRRPGAGASASFATWDNSWATARRRMTSAWSAWAGWL